jgi:hypothetical protein
MAMVVALVAASTASVGPAAASPAASAMSTAAARCSATTRAAQNVWLAGAITSARPVRWYRVATRTNRWAMVTLGGLSADLSLTLYDSACRVVAASNRAADHFEQIYRYLPAGHYFARVGGVSGATSTYDLRFRPLRNGVLVLSSHAYRHDGMLTVAGEALNNQSVRWFMRWVDVTYYNRAGGVIARDEGSFYVSPVRPRHRTTFFDERPVPRGYDHYRLRVVSESLSWPPPANLRILPGIAWTDSLHRRHFPGLVRNSGSSDVILASVIYTLYGKHGQVLYAASSVVEPGTVKPGATAAYDVVFDTVAGMNGMSRMANA